jgi:hypothetical protein
MLKAMFLLYAECRGDTTTLLTIKQNFFVIDAPVETYYDRK